MPEESLETHELKEQLEETHEHIEHGHHDHGGKPDDKHGHKGPAWTLYLSLSTALIAVLAAISSLQSGAMESHALIEKNEAILSQAKATNQWGYFQAKGTKSAIYEAESEALVDKPEVVEKFKKNVERYKDEQIEIKAEAETLDKETVEHGEVGEEFLHHHHRFALAVTIFQVSIALAAIAALTKRQMLWFGSLLVGLGGIFFFLKGFGLLGG
jgi:hypothetical protein